MNKPTKIDVSKLVFKPSFLQSPKITVRITTLGRHYPMTRDQIINCIASGLHHDKINSWFTQESIKEATKIEAVTKPKKDKNES